MPEKKNIVGFKKFSDIKKPNIEEVDLSSGIRPEVDSDRPMNPNLPGESNKIEKPSSRDGIMPQTQDVNLPDDEDLQTVRDSLVGGLEVDESEVVGENVQTIGKVARFPKNVKASKAYNFLENVKVSKKSIWYIMVEKDNELQMVKYNYKEGVNLNEFVNELKSYYIQKNKENQSVCESISKIMVDGNDKFSMIRNIPPIEVEGRKLITKITEDLIKLLSR